MSWMQRHSRRIAAVALIGLVAPFLVTGLSTLTSIPPVYLAVGLAILVGAALTWRYLVTRDDDTD